MAFYIYKNGGFSICKKAPAATSSEDAHTVDFPGEEGPLLGVCFDDIITARIDMRSGSTVEWVWTWQQTMCDDRWRR